MHRIAGLISAAVDTELDLSRERSRQTVWIEPLADGAGVAGLLPDDRCALRLEPLDRLVEALPDSPLNTLVTGRAFAPKLLPFAMPPDHAGRQEHRAADPRSLLTDGDGAAELTEPGGSDEAGHARTGDAHYVSENVGLCSTYSMRTRSGPQRNAAYVFAASTTDSTSIPRSEASAITPSAESTSTARWFRSGRSGSPGSPSWNTTNAPPTSTRPLPRRREAVPLVLPRGLERRGRPQGDVVEVVLDIRLRLNEGQPDSLSGLEHIRCARGQSSAGRGQIGDAQSDMLQRAVLTRAIGVEQRQLAATGIAAEQGEVLFVRDDVHADVPLEERDDGRTVGDPEGNVVESPRLHHQER